MKAEELRIGNWISVPDSFKPIRHNTAVRDIHKDGINKHWGGEAIYFYNLVQPIPLNEEWLLKFGFEQECIDDYIIDLKDGCQLSVDIKNKKVYIGESVEWGCPRINYNYVHQLQNLYFALTGEELTIKE